VVSAGFVFVGERLAVAVPAFAAVNLALVGGWLLIAGRLTTLRIRRVAAGSA
jgi:hypothetical protein